MGLDLQADRLTAGLAGHYQPDEKRPQSQIGKFKGKFKKG